LLNNLHQPASDPEVDLAGTKREFQLLPALLSRPDPYFPAEQLFGEARHDDSPPEESLRTYISRVHN
jgi:DNA-binding response OmpR family regulator